MSLKVLRTLAFSELTSKNTLYLANAFVNCVKKKEIWSLEVLNIAIVHLIWHLCKASGARKVERVQKRALKIVYNTHSVEYFNLLNCANLPSLQSRRLQNLATLMH